MADPSASQTAFADRPTRSDTDLEKGVSEPNSDVDAATIVPESGSGAPAGEKREAEDQDPNVVTWDGPDDPANPMNWTMRKKWSNIAVLSVLTIIT